VRGSLVGDAFCNEDVYKGERTHSEAHEALQGMPLSADLPIEKWAGSSTDERLDLQNRPSRLAIREAPIAGNPRARHAPTDRRRVNSTIPLINMGLLSYFLLWRSSINR
jgi:hypothetical protein